MSKIINIIKGPYSMAKTYYANRGEFGSRIALYKALSIFAYHFPKSWIYKHVFTTLNNSIYDYLVYDLHETIERYLNNHKEQDNSTCTITPVIWQSWWQGKNELSGITKLCTESIKKHSNGIPIVFVDKDNYPEYVKIPDKVLNWLYEGRIGFTHFADYLRMALMFQNGGIWFDCAIYASKDIDRNTLNYAFYAPKGTVRDYRYISLDMWSTGCMACAKGFPMMELYLQLYEAYFEKHSKLIDYYLTDFFMRIAYENIKEVKIAVDKVPFNNPAKQVLAEVLNNRYNERDYYCIINATSIFKLSRKIKLSKVNHRGELTYYGRLSEEYGIS